MLYPYRPAGEHRLPGLRPGGAAGPGALLGLMRDVGQLFDCEPVVLQRPDSPALLLFYPDTVTTRDLNKSYIYAWKKGIKTLYYMRLRQMALEGTEVEGCVSCML